MVDAPIPLSWDQQKYIIGGALTVLAVTAGGIWKFMSGYVRQWKDLYDAKEKELASTRDAKDKELTSVRSELEEVKRNPTTFAMNQIAESEKLMTAQISKLQHEIHSLKAKCIEKDEDIRNLITIESEREAKLIYLEEEREKFKWQIQAFEEIVQRLLSRRDQARNALTSFKSGFFDVERLDSIVNAEIKDRMREIDAASFSRTSQIMRKASTDASIKAEARASHEMKEKLAKKETAKDEAKMRLYAQLPNPKSDRK